MFKDNFVTLKSGVKMPILGLGLYKVAEGEDTVFSVKTAIENGYRSIDCAQFYANEEGMGKGISLALESTKLKRKDLFVTSKVWNSAQGYDNTLKAVEEGLKKAKLNYFDLYLIHWPVEGKFEGTWRALERLYEEGVLKAIGVSNFNEHHLKKLFLSANIKPMIDQMECHPYLILNELREILKKEDIAFEAWAPLMKGRLLSDPVILDIAKEIERTPAQTVLRWHLERDTIVIPKSIHKERIIENSQIFDFSLSEEQIKRISALNKNLRSGSDPDNFNF